MKTFAIALTALGLTALGLTAGAVHADSFRAEMDRQRHDIAPVSTQAEYSVQVPVETVASNKDLVNSPLSAGDLVTVTRIPSSGVIDNGK